jgi:hypothetical protein
MFAGSELELAVLGAFVGEFEELRDDRSCFVLSKVSAASSLSAGVTATSFGIVAAALRSGIFVVAAAAAAGTAEDEDAAVL